MAVRLGIEISRAACRVVQIERASGADEETIVRACAVMPAADIATALAPYRGQKASVVTWGLASDHRQAVVTTGRYARMRREAVSAARQAGIDTREMLADIAPVETARSQGRRRPVVIALARTSDVAAAAQRVTDAGVRVRSVATPALALMSLARLRGRLLAAGLAEAYVALEETCTAIALVRDGALVAARELEAGFRDAAGDLRSRDDVARTLGDAIAEFFDACGAPPSAVAQICICGGMPDLRSMTIALTERLDVEVEPLDSLFGIDADRLPAEDFREHVSDLRLAWAAAADWNAPINFLRERRRRVVKRALTRAAIAAGVATGLGIAWRIQQSAWLEPAKPAVKSRPAPRPKPAAAAPSSKPTPVAPPRVAATPPPVITPPRPVAPPPRQVTAAPPPAQKITPPAPSPVAAKPAPVPAPPPRVAVSRPQVVLTPVPEPSRPAPPRESQTQTPPRPAVTAPPTTATPAPAAAAPSPVAATPVPAARPTPRPPRPAPAEEAPTPFDASLGTILYGADRKLAIVDGRIVQVGDDVRGARVVEITPNSVLFRDRAGQLRQLSLDASRR